MSASQSGEERYIRKRLRRAAAVSLAFRLCRIFPVRKGKVVLWTLEGKGGFACSPKYIALELLRRNREEGSAWKLYWIAGGTAASSGRAEFPPEITLVRDTFWSRVWHLSTAQFWVGNTRTPLGTKKRRGTCYLMAWHGSIALKPIGLYRGEKFSRIARLVSEADSKLIDIALSGSRWCTRMWRKGLLYDGRIEETGNPRCDVLLAGAAEKRRQLRDACGIPQDAEICLYAPTFRGGSQSTLRSVDAAPISLDLAGLLDALEKRFGGTWYLFLRLHPQLAAALEHMPLPEKLGAAGGLLAGRIVDVTGRPDMAEIMAATDCLITDYSTVIFEGFMTGQPGFIYADDFDAYTADRGTLMFAADEIPFPVARTNSELFRHIQTFDAGQYKTRCAQFKERMGMVDDGSASRRAADIMEKIARGESVG